MKYNFEVDGVSIEAVLNKLGGVPGAKQFLAGELVVQPAVIPEPPPEPVLDFIVRVDRSVKPRHPAFARKLMNPELELAGPVQYNLKTAVEQWLHDDQKGGGMVGSIIYEFLQKGDELATCLNLQDGLAIQKKGIAVFRKLFAGKSVSLWGSVVEDDIGRLFVPYLTESGGSIVVSAGWLGGDWDSRDPALRFSKAAQLGK